MAQQYPGEVVVLALAALTNVALALHLDPRLQEKLVRSWPAATLHSFGEVAAVLVALTTVDR